MTFGALRLRLRLLLPAVAEELLDGWIQDRYTEILDNLSWKRLETERTVQVPASYATGTVTLTRSSIAVVGVGTAWTSAMNGLMFRANNQDEYYTFTYVSTTTGTLDRAYEQATASALTYRIDQNLFVMPAGCRVIRSVQSMHDLTSPLIRKTPVELDAVAGTRNSYGTPKYYAPSYDNFSDPPRMQIEFYPVPDSPNALSSLLSFVVDMVIDPDAIDTSDTSVNMLPWARPACLIAGVQADATPADSPARDRYEARFQSLLNDMKRINAEQRGPQQIQVAREYQRPPGMDWEDERVVIAPET